MAKKIKDANPGRIPNMPGESFEHTLDEVLLIILIFLSLGTIYLLVEKKCTDKSKIHGIFEKYFNFFAPVPPT